MQINKYIDHTLLKSTATQADIKKLCEEALEYNFFSVCINPYWIKYAKTLLKDSDVKVCTVIGFPLGANSSINKKAEAIQAIQDGADELDMVINNGLLLGENYSECLKDMKSVKETTNNNKVLVKIILENCLLTNEQIKKACELALEAKIDFVKTSTGFSEHGATIEHVKLMKQTVGDNAKVKAAGGVRSYEDAINMIEAGASRLGTSNGVAIMKNKKVDGQNY
ncbi:deoxyribose-phosphate aldolase [Spiroplasma endosymbiont of Amphibalanus improvisus]|uniref:deoxyribose-phosphate aldolase n=1 Tax=Spiroplasma endosymbiont of Amphibalanus improvisus TaxID=3066327 RepID=UPI00313E3552